MIDWTDYPRYRISPQQPSELRHVEVLRLIESLRTIRPGGLQVEPLGESVEGRSISLLTMGSGSQTVFAWSQMHGDEPTHTAALLDLINFLQQDPDHPTASAILANCKLQMIVMLNPDGVERFTRRNAQGIDVNRDALHLQSSEGKILRAAVETLRPDYALNLHNQRPRTTVGRSQQVASFSLLVPPVDLDDSQTEGTERAKKLACCMARAVADYCPGAVSRYNADFMPRCFGEWVQQQGAATITIEAGGWSTTDDRPLVQLHFYGLMSGLEAIATGGVLEADPSEYDALSATGEQDLFDCLLRGIWVHNGLDHPPFRADLGVNYSHMQRGTVVDLGDLSVTSGKTLIEGSDLACLPGRIVWVAEASPSCLPDRQNVEALLAAGVTTVIGQIDLAAAYELEAFEKLRDHWNLEVNVGYLAKLTQWSDEIRDRLLRAISQGVLGVVAEDVSEEAKHYLQWFGVPLISVEDLQAADDEFATLHQCAQHTYKSAQQLGLGDRGAIRLGTVADFLLLKSDATLETKELRVESILQQVLVGGNVVFDCGEVTGQASGVMLMGRVART